MNNPTFQGANQRKMCPLYKIKDYLILFVYSLFKIPSLEFPWASSRSVPSLASTSIASLPMMPQLTATHCRVTWTSSFQIKQPIPHLFLQFFSNKWIVATNRTVKSFRTDGPSMNTTAVGPYSSNTPIDSFTDYHLSVVDGLTLDVVVWHLTSSPTWKSLEFADCLIHGYTATEISYKLVSKASDRSPRGGWVMALVHQANHPWSMISTVLYLETDFFLHMAFLSLSWSWQD